ncbi:serine--tRNA ligase [bacterium]|nr:MAG: serine--tRNA ligase [bacterium]
MLDRELIRRQPDFVRAGIERKGLDASIVDAFLAADESWRAARTKQDAALADSNRVSKGIGALMAQGKKEEAEAAKAEASRLKAAIPEIEAEARTLEAALRQIELEMPNLPNENVPDGKGENDNVVRRVVGNLPTFDGFTPKPHWEIADQHGLFDLPRGAKIAGSGFPVYMGLGARLQRALVSFYADSITFERGFQEVYPPIVVNRESLVGTGQLPKFEEDLYRTTDDLFLVPTAEVPITNLYRDEILDASALPIRLAGYSACFRREAGAAGKDTRGIQRVHQFDKVEMVKFTTPETSYEELETMTADAESILQALGLHYRVIEICTGDIGPKGTRQYDLEVWAPGVEKWLEVSSCSNFEAYQSRRANVRYRPEAGAKPEFVHILNGSALAVPRVYAAILEQFQQADGSVLLPEVLHRYMRVEKLG